MLNACKSGHAVCVSVHVLCEPRLGYSIRSISLFWLEWPSYIFFLHKYKLLIVFLTSRFIFLIQFSIAIMLGKKIIAHFYLCVENRLKVSRAEQEGEKKNYKPPHKRTLSVGCQSWVVKKKTTNEQLYLLIFFSHLFFATNAKTLFLHTHK